MFGCVERRGIYGTREAHEADVTLGVARLVAVARAFRVKAEQHERLSDEVRVASANLRRAILLALADGLTADDIRSGCVEPMLKRSSTSEEAAAAVEQAIGSVEKHWK
jgi:cell division septum initiation protein DivIVA